MAGGNTAASVLLRSFETAPFMLFCEASFPVAEICKRKPAERAGSLATGYRSADGFACSCPANGDLHLYFSSFAGRNAEPHHGNDVLNGIPAILLQPFMDDAHEAVDIEQHEVLLIRRRYVKAFQNRLENVAI